MPNQSDWLSASKDVASTVKAGEPICLLIGAGASLSSGGPHTTGVAEALMHARPDAFPDVASVFDNGDAISIYETDHTIHGLLDGMSPNIGYRCLAAIARHRPVVLINLNWDDCAVKACETLGFSSSDYAALDLEDVKGVRKEWLNFKERGYGLLSVHPHGMLRRGDLRFATKSTLKFEADQRELLGELMSLPMIVVGTSLSGPWDVTDLVKAMTPAPKTSPTAIKPLWVLERGRSRREPGIHTQAGGELRMALDARKSSLNFIAAPELDFDLFMTTLRAREVNLSWNSWIKDLEGGVNLPELARLVMPNPHITRTLLDAENVLLTGPAEVGKSVIAHLIAHWRAILAAGVPPHKTTGRREAQAALGELANHTPDKQSSVLLCDDCFGLDPGEHDGKALEQLLHGVRGSAQIVMTSTPKQLLAAGYESSRSSETIDVMVLGTEKTWTAAGLRNYARRLAKGRPETAAALIGRIDRRELRTPRQVARAVNNLAPPREREEEEQRELTAHVEDMCRKEEKEALLLALLRLQDLSHPRTIEELKVLTAANIERVERDPWDLVRPFQMDSAYLRLSDSAVVAAVDRCIEKHHFPLTQKMEAGGERLRWALDAIAQWDVLRETASTTHAVEGLDDYQREMFGPSLVDNAMDDEARALEVLEALRLRAHDELALRDTALVLLSRWDRLEKSNEALVLRDRFLEDDARNGMYALFEGLLRRGGWAPPAVWHAVVARVLDLARGRNLNSNERARRRQVALCFDALLWRPAPAENSEHAILMRNLLDGAKDDPLLRSMFAVAVAYHHSSAKRLTELGVTDPLSYLGEVNEDQALEMAWMVAWHFIHQSRNRAVASRRFFNSTHASMRSDGRQKLLDRRAQHTPLPKEWAEAVDKVAHAMGRWPTTACWALHLIMNIHATAGEFSPHEVHEIIKHTPCDAPGLIAAAIAYKPTPDMHDAIRPLLCSREGKAAILAGLGEGVLVNGVRVGTPRFLLTHEEWGSLRKRWQIDDEELWSYFELDPSKSGPMEAIVILEKAVPEALEMGAKRSSVTRVLHHLRRGDTRPFKPMTDSLILRNDKKEKEGGYGSLLKAAAIWLEEHSPLDET